MNASFALEYAKLKLNERYPNGYKAVFEYVCIPFTSLEEKKINAVNQYYYLIYDGNTFSVNVDSDSGSYRIRQYGFNGDYIDKFLDEHTGEITLKNTQFGTEKNIRATFLIVSVIPEKSKKEETAALVALD